MISIGHENEWWYLYLRNFFVGIHFLIFNSSVVPEIRIKVWRMRVDPESARQALQSIRNWLRK